MPPGPSESFTLQGHDVVLAYFESEPDVDTRRAVGAFIDSLLEDPRAIRGVPVSGTTLNEESRFVPAVDVVVTWFVAWGERVVWVRKIEGVPLE